MSAYFIASTGTGVGKTFTTCALLHALRAGGHEVRGFKPVISGWEEGNGTDTAQIITASGHPQTVEQTSPWRFAAPLSPHRAAALEEKTIDVAALADWTHAQAQANGFTLIETVGGVMVPLTDTQTTLDWMGAVRLPVILVVGSYLGTISHTLTAVAALKAQKLSIAALILNESTESAVPLAEAEAGLAPFVRDIPLRITQPLVSSWREASAIAGLGMKL